MKIEYDSNNFIWQYVNDDTDLTARSGHTVTTVGDQSIDLLDYTGSFPNYKYTNQEITPVASYIEYSVDINIWRKYVRYIRRQLDELYYDIIENVELKQDLSGISNPVNNRLVYVVSIDRLYIYVSSESMWKLVFAEIERTDIINWYPSVPEYADLYEYSAEDGDCALARSDNIIYRYTLATNRWTGVVQYGQSMFRGCRLVYDTATTIKVQSGVLSIHTVPLYNAVDLSLTWSDVMEGATKKANTWYYVYAEINPNFTTSFSAYISENPPSDSVFNPTKDSYIKKGSANTNFGTETLIKIENNGDADINTKRAYLGFDLSSVASSEFTTSHIHFNVEYIETSADNTIKVYEVSNSWTETALTWNNAPALGTLIATSGTVTTTGGYAIDITNYIKQKILANQKTISLAFVATTQNGKEIHITSRESTTSPKPYIHITTTGIGTEKYSTTRNARLIGTFRTDASQNIMRFYRFNNRVMFETGYNYILIGGISLEKSGVNCRTYVPYSTDMPVVYYEMSSDNNLKYIGTLYAWLLNATEGSGDIIMPMHDDLIYYKVASVDKPINIGIHGYIEEL